MHLHIHSAIHFHGVMLNTPQAFLKKETTLLVHLHLHSSIHRHDVVLTAVQVFQKQAAQSPRSSAEVTNTWSYTSGPLHITRNGAEWGKGITVPSVLYK